MAWLNGERVKWIVAVILTALVGYAGGQKVGSKGKDAAKVEASAVAPANTAVVAYATGPGGCMHFDGSEWVCPGSKELTIAGDRLFLRGDSIVIGSISVRYRDSTFVLPVPPRVDALFFTPEAAQILAEHYDATNPAKAAALRQLLNSLPHP